MKSRLKTLLTNKKLLFIVAGLGNTAIDFVIFNLAIVSFGLKPWVANIISTSVAMVLSFLVNKHAVFGDNGKGTHMQFIAFVAVTAAGLWGLQTAIVVGASALLHHIAGRLLGLTGRSAELLIPNVAKVVATVASALWNYVWYDRVIFARSPAKGALEEWM